MIGTTLSNRYELTGELGRGGMGVVYRAKDPLLGREVAIKLIPPTMLSEEAEDRFRREAQIVAQMDHPSIVSIYDLGNQDGSLFFVMPVVQGTSLRQMLRERSLSLGEVIEIGIQIADALDYSHRRSVVHRDIKPENVIVAREEGGKLRVRVMDFGLARTSSETRITRTGTLIGTLAYLSPEQVAVRAVDGRSDIYSLGAVLYECLVGEPPFVGEMQGVLYRIVHEIPQSLRALGADVGEELEGIVMSCLAKDADRRPQTAALLEESLRRYDAKLHDADRVRVAVGKTTRTLSIDRPAGSAFVGREREVALMQQRLQSALLGECQLVIVGGEPGVGKTRLLQELENLARARRIRVLHGRFVEQDRSFAYQGFCEAIQEWFRGAGEVSSAGLPDLSDLAADLVTLFPVMAELAELRTAAAGSSLGREATPRKIEDRTYIFEILARTLTRLGGGKPLVLVFEELHGAEISLEALQYVIRRLGPTPTLVLGTYRTTEIEKGHPLMRLIDSFSGDRRFEAVALGPLSGSEHDRLVSSLVGGAAIGSALARRLFEASEGNPFFAKELVRSLSEAGSLRQDESGAWTFSGAAEISSDGLPATIQQAVEKRVERLPEDERDLLAVASVLGRSFEYRDLELLLEDGKGFEDAVDRLIRAGLIEEERESRGDRLAFASGVVRDVLYGTISRRRRRQLHRRAAELLEKRHAGRLERVYPQLLHHWSQADEPEKSVEYGLRLARRALESWSADDCLRMTKVALEFLEDPEWTGDKSLEGEARLLSAEAHRMAGNVEAALKDAGAAAKICERQGRKERAASAILFAAETAWQERRVEEARSWMERGLAVGDDARREDRVRLLSLAATIASLRGEHARAKELYEEADLLDETRNDASAGWSLETGGTLVVGLTQRLESLDPVNTAIVEEAEVQGGAFERLLVMDDQGVPIPWLCRSWESRDGGRSFVFRLREDVVFSDGHLFDAEEVRASFESAVRSARQELPSALAAIRGAAELARGEVEGLVGASVAGRYELVLELKEPMPIFPALLTDQKVSIVRGSDRRIGTGPFRFETTSPTEVVLERNPRYWRGLPAKIERLRFAVVDSTAEMHRGLMAGRLDVARNLAPDDLDRVLRDPRFRSGLVEAPQKNTYFILFNQSGPLARHAALRRALARVLRPHDLVWRTLGRFAQPAVGLIPPGLLGHDSGRRLQALSIAEARALIETTGLQLPIRMRAAVHPLIIDRYRRLVEAIGRIWAEVGVEFENLSPDLASFLESDRDCAEVDFQFGRWSADYDDADNFTHFIFHSKAGVFRHFYCSEEADALGERARQAARREEREKLYRGFENLLYESSAVIPLLHDIDYRIAHPRVLGLKLSSAAPYVNYAELAIGRTALKKGGSAGAGRLDVPIAGVVEELDPALTASLEQTETLTNVFETLTRDAAGGRIVPWLAQDVITEDGGRRYRFRLREGVRFHNGRTLTARDVRFSFERLLQNPRGDSRFLLAPIKGARALLDGQAGDLSGFRILSPRELVIELESPVSFFPALISYPVASIVPEGTEQVAGDWREGAAGTGPFRVTRFEPGQVLELDRNPSYWRSDVPGVDRLVFHFAVPPDRIRDGFRSGQFSTASDLFPGDAEALRLDPQFAPGYREIPWLSTYYLVFNCWRPPFVDEAFRRRVTARFDVPKLIGETMGRLAMPARGLIPPGLLGFEPSPRKRPTEMPGRPVDTFAVSAAVHPVFFGEYVALYKRIQEILAEVGITLEVINKDMATYMEVRQAGAADLVIGRWGADFSDADTFVHGVLHTTHGLFGRLCGSDDIDRLAEQGRVELEASARHEIYREIESILEREARLLPLFHGQVYRFARPELEGLSLSFSSPVVAYDQLRFRKEAE